MVSTSPPSAASGPSVDPRRGSERGIPWPIERLHRLVTHGEPEDRRSYLGSVWAGHVEAALDDGVTRSAVRRLAGRAAIAHVVHRMGDADAPRTALPAGFLAIPLGIVTMLFALTTYDDQVPDWVYLLLGASVCALGAGMVMQPRLLRCRTTSVTAPGVAVGTGALGLHQPVVVAIDWLLRIGFLVAAAGFLAIGIGSLLGSRPAARATSLVGVWTAAAGALAVGIATMVWWPLDPGLAYGVLSVVAGALGILLAVGVAGLRTLLDAADPAAGRGAPSPDLT